MPEWPPKAPLIFPRMSGPKVVPKSTCSNPPPSSLSKCRDPKWFALADARCRLGRQPSHARRLERSTCVGWATHGCLQLGGRGLAGRAKLRPRRRCSWRKPRHRWSYRGRIAEARVLGGGGDARSLVLTRRSARQRGMRALCRSGPGSNSRAARRSPRLLETQQASCSPLSRS